MLTASLCITASDATSRSCLVLVLLLFNNLWWIELNPFPVLDEWSCLASNCGQMSQMSVVYCMFLGDLLCLFTSLSPTHTCAHWKMQTNTRLHNNYYAMFKIVCSLSVLYLWAWIGLIPLNSSSLSSLLVFEFDWLFIKHAWPLMNYCERTSNKLF